MPHFKRPTFFKLGYNHQHIPNQGSYERRKKPRLAQWDDPPFDWPPKMPRATMHKGKTLINVLDHEEKERRQKEMGFSIPDFRSGDVVKITRMQSLSEKKETEYSGLVF